DLDIFRDNLLLIFFFQAEDGIRDKLVTGVQTCALPIYRLLLGHRSSWSRGQTLCPCRRLSHSRTRWKGRCSSSWATIFQRTRSRSEERRVGKECRSQW